VNVICKNSATALKDKNLKIMGNEEGEKELVKSVDNILNKIIAEKCPNLKKKMLIQVQEASRAPKRHD
jgi:hypothetical protein